MTTVTSSPLVPVTALILAGGQSSRMGVDKALLPWEGVPLLQRVCDVAVQCSDRVAILTPWPERYQGVLVNGDRYDWFLEARPGGGPLAALAQGLGHVSTPWVLLLACDLPQLQPEILHQWRHRLATLPATTPALVPRQSAGWEPLCGFYRQSTQAALTDFLQGGGRSFQTWLTQSQAQAINLDPTPSLASMLWNCNTSGDFPPL